MPLETASLVRAKSPGRRIKSYLAIVGGVSLVALGAARYVDRGESAASALAAAPPQGSAAAVRAACKGNDDAAMGVCPGFDAAAWCGGGARLGDQLAPGTPFRALCGAACEGSEGPDWAMVCAWEAVARLPEVCAGTFEPTLAPEDLPNAPKPRSAQALDARDAVEVDAPQRPAATGVDGADFRLFPCDAHAVCLGCYAGGGGALCDEAAAHYGGYAFPDMVRGTPSERFPYVGATTSVHLLNTDLAYWCAKLAARR
ncbi:hypothetical protein M885DRAFT_569625 [Pelagophyceae sp. CCMP2097]|nr:hypothetical protein M885DRAFT_569625 [Pelagophyceae sp. CCMP2097]